MQILAVSEVSDGSYCKHNLNGGIESYAAYLIFKW